MARALPSICVFCGARNGANPGHVATARALGAVIAAEGWRLVYGAGDVGLMGEVARSVQSAGAATMGVIPIQLVITQDMHERKKVMFMNSDAIVVLPGGAGTLDEFFEVLTWAILGLHAKPIYLLDNDGYWQPLIALIDHVVAQGFADASITTHFAVVPDVETLTTALRAALS